MTNKEKLQAKYTEVLGEVPMDVLTAAQLKAAIEDAESRGEATEKKEAKQTKLFEPKCSGKFWKNPAHFENLGTVTGAVTPEQEEEFYAATKNNIPPADIMTKVLDYDPIAKREQEARERMRKRAGLPPEK